MFRVQGFKFQPVAKVSGFTMIAMFRVVADT